MRLAILAEGYLGAGEAFSTGATIAADASRALRQQLSTYAAMAGDDATATDFAASYDTAAGEAAWAVAELAGGFASVAGLTAISLANHHAAELAAGGQPPWRPPAPPGLVELMSTTPPSTLGADSDALPGWASVVLDLLEGAVWPDADTGRLRDAATTWRTAARSVALLGAHCSTALGALADERSPEIPLALATTEELRRHVGTLADQMGAIAVACDAYAEQVDAKREEMLHLLESLGKELLAGAVVAGALSFVSGGLAAGAASGAASGRVAAASRELMVIVDALRVLNGSTAATLRPVAATVRDSRSFLARLLKVELIRADERGAAGLGRSMFPRGWLRDHEAAGGHVIRKHVGRTDEQLIDRVTTSGGPKFASSFFDQATAEKYLERLLHSNSDQIRLWLKTNPDERLILTQDFGVNVGRSANRAGDVFDVTGIRAILEADSTMPGGYHILTAHPGSARRP